MSRPGLVTHFFGLIGLISVLIAGAAGLWVAGMAQAGERKELDDAALAEAVGAAREVEGVVEGHRRALRTVAAELESEVATQGTQALSSPRTQALLHVVRANYGGFSFLYVGDVHGRSVVAEPPYLDGKATAGTDYSDRLYFRALFDPSLEAARMVERGKRTRKPGVHLTAAVHGPDGALVGYVLGSVELEQLQEVADGIMAGVPGMVLAVTDANHRVILHPDRPLRDGMADLGGMALFQAPRSSAAELHEGPDASGIPSRGASVATSAWLGWTVIAYVPDSALSARVAATTRPILAAGLAALIIALLAFAGLARWLAQPIRQLSRTALGASRGEFTAVPAPRRWESREVTILLEAMAGMIDGVRANTELLEHRVAERTGELQRSNGELEQSLAKLRDAQARLALADRMASIGTLAAGVAHEINNPLAYIRSNLDFVLQALAESAPPADPEMVEALEEARIGADRVRDIVRGLKQVSRPDEGQRIHPVELAPVLEQALAMTANELKHRAVVVRELQDVPPVLGSEVKLAQVFINLLVNAAQAIPSGDAARHEVTVRTRVHGDWVAVEIQDTGHGIAPANLNRIFDPFFTTKPVGQGTGLGLAICHGIVSGLGGEIQVESREGEGSIFRVLLRPAPEVAAPRPQPPERPRAGRRGKVLIVDDEPLVAKAVERMLASSHDVVVETSAARALARLEHGERFDVILCDLMMPDMGGQDLFERLGTRERDELVFVTGGAFTPAAQGFLASITNARLEKPFAPEELMRLVNSRVAAAV